MEQSPTNFSKPHREQMALSTIIEKLIADFEQTLSPWGVLDYEGPTPLRYMGQSTSDLIKLHDSVRDLESQVNRILPKFVLTDEVRRTLDEIAKISNEIIHSEDAKDLIAKWEGSGRSLEIKVDDGLATNLANQMHILWENIEKLRKSNIPKPVSQENKPDIKKAA